MRRSSYFQDAQPEAEVLAVFGDARLVKHLSGKVELRGGSVEDQRAAREWAEKFIPELTATLPRPSDRRNSVNKRGFVQGEFRLAVRALQEIPLDQIFVIPVRIDRCPIPDEFNHLQWTTLKHTNDFEKLVNALSKRVIIS
jgi:hypothetical protein